jgi:hypothetical protein
MSDSASPPPRRRRKWAMRDLVTLLVVAVPIAAVYFLPPDTSLQELQKSGVLTACVPASYPPLVTGAPDSPGFDVALLQEIAGRLGLRLSLNINPGMGRDFNIRNWGVNRAQCQVLAGGVVASATTRSFMDTIDTGVETGWALIQKAQGPLAEGARVGVFAGSGGLNRLALSSFFREHGVRVSLVPSAQALVERMAAGEFDAGVTEGLGAWALAQGHAGWTVAWLPEPLERYSLAFGLWKGDLTLKRRLVGLLETLESEGIVEALRARYGMGEITAVAAFDQ